MKVSLIVPVYNVECYLNKCIDSLIGQNYADYEILLIDDGSTDKSSIICEEYSNKYSNIYTYHKVNGGLSSARNYGLNKAKGDWIVFIDSDDYWVSNDVLSSLLQTAYATGADLVRFEYFAVDESGVPLYEYSYDSKNGLLDRTLSTYELFHNGIAGEFFTWLFMMRRSLIGDLRFDENCKFQEDIDFALRLFATRSFNCAYCDYHFYAYRKRRNSLTTTPVLSNIAASFALSDRFYNYADMTSDRRLQNDYRYNAIMMYYWTLCTFIEMPYFKIRRDAFKTLNVNSFRKKAILRMIKHRIFNKTSLLICLPYSWSVILIYIRSLFVFKRKSM